MVYRVYVEKKKELANEAKALLSDIRTLLGIAGVSELRIINRYDADKIEKELFEYAKYMFLHPVTLLLIALLLTFSILRLLRGARMASAAKAGKLVPNDELDTKDGGIPSEESDQSEK